MMSEYILLCIYWMTFYALHSLLASLMFKNWVERKFPAVYAYYRIFYNLIALSSLGAVLYYHQKLSAQTLIRIPFLLEAFAWMLMLGAVVVLWLSFRHYSLKEFAGLKTEQPSSSSLNIQGLNRWVRHPLYFGVLLGIVGILLQEFSLRNLLAGLILCGYLLIGIYLEEQKLLQHFGEEYREYQKNTKTLIPFIL